MAVETGASSGVHSRHDSLPECVVLQRPVAKLAVLEVAGTAREDSEQYGSGNVANGNRSAIEQRE